MAHSQLVAGMLRPILEPALLHPSPNSSPNMNPNQADVVHLAANFSMYCRAGKLYSARCF